MGSLLPEPVTGCNSIQEILLEQQIQDFEGVSDDEVLHSGLEY